MPSSSMPVKKTGYQGFGSFHTENVEDLLLRNISALPSDPFDVPPMPSVEFGKHSQCHFLIDFDRWTFVNHGAFGAVLRHAMTESNQWRDYCEQQPLKFLDRELFPHMIRVLKEVAPMIGADCKDIALLHNATTGINVVMNSIPLSSSDVVYMLDIGYGAVKKVLQVAAEKTGAKVVFGQIDFPLRRSSEIVSAVESTMPANTKLAVFDAVTSNTAIVLPLKELIELCRSRGVQVLIDGAHALGMLPLDLSHLQPDYFVTNCHKWFCGPRGTAILWVRLEHKAGVRPLVLSHGSGSGFTSDFLWDGMRDYAPPLALSAAVRFWNGVGLERAQAYMTSLLSEAVAHLCDKWGTGTLVPLDMCGAMALVALPTGLAGSGAEGSADSADAKYIQDLLHFEHQVEVPVKCIQNVLYVRISAHIYNELADYETLAEAILKIQKATVA